MHDAKAYSAAGTTSRLVPDTIQRRDTTENDVQIDIVFCGICHSDLHHARDERHDPTPAGGQEVAKWQVKLHLT